MKNNLLLKILSSLPLILITLYFLPFLGVCLILLRFFTSDHKKISTSLYIIGIGILIILPKGLSLILEMAKIDYSAIPYLGDIVGAELYTVDFINYSKRLITIGGIFFIISLIAKAIFAKVNNGLTNYIREIERKNAEIGKQNDMEIKIKQQKAKNTSYVKCPNCGSDNLVAEKFSTCKYCRRKIENKNFKA